MTLRNPTRSRRFQRLLALAAASGLVMVAGPAQTQIVQPKHSLHAVVNGVFDLCPKLVAGSMAFPGAEAAEPFGYRPTPTENVGELWLEGMFSPGLVQLRYGRAEGHCTVNYSGAGFDTIAAMVRQVSTQQLKYTKLPGDGGPVEAYARLSADKTRTQQYALVEDKVLKTVAVRYTEAPVS